MFSELYQKKVGEKVVPYCTKKLFFKLILNPQEVIAKRKFVIKAMTKHLLCVV